MLVSFADNYGGAFNASPVRVDADVWFFRNSGELVAENSIEFEGTFFSDLQSVAGDTSIDGASGKVFFEVDARGGNVFGIFSQSIGTYAAGQRMPSVNEVPAGSLPTPTPAPNGPFDRNVLLDQFSSEVMLPAVRDFVGRAETLVTATEAWANSLNTTDRSAARSAWSSAMKAFQFLEPLQFGPAGPSTKFAGGLGIRDEIYSWPTVNYCAVDQVTVDGDFSSPEFFSSKLVNVYGLDAMELLLFRPGEENSCSSRIDINRNGTWDDLVASGGLSQSQADYAAVIAAGVLQEARRLRDAWEPSGGNFAGALRSAGRGSAVFGSAKEAFDEIFAAFFFADTILKDLKLALPAGITPECPSEACPEYVEFPFSQSSKQAIIANLDGLRAIFAGEGTSGDGFAWYLEDQGAAALGERMSDQLASATVATELIPGDLTGALTADRSAVSAAHAELQLFTTDMKSEFVSVLNLTIPQEGAGDND